MHPSPHVEPKAKLLGARLLRKWPLPQPDGEGDKQRRGTVLVVGGAPQMPGGIILAATAALRAGAGKLQIATCRSIAPVVAAAVPESYVERLAESKSGAIASSAIGTISKMASDANAILLGPGMVDEDALAKWLPDLFARMTRSEGVVVLDAAPLCVLRRHKNALREYAGRATITPHAGEMASITGLPKGDVCRAPQQIALRVSSESKVVVALKGAVTYIAAPDGDLYRNEAGNVGLATSGSGDALSGIVAGLAARGADALQATAWGVHLHACAGDRLIKRTGGTLGFLARELLAEIPAVMASFGR